MLLIEDKPVQIIPFPNGEVRYDLSRAVPLYAERIKLTLRFESDAELMQLLMIKKHLDITHPQTPIDLVMPYIPYSRMDRTEGIEVFTLKYFAKFINDLNFRHVHVLEPHSNVSLALFDRLMVSSLKDLGLVSKAIGSVKRQTGQNPVLFYPDAGAVKRYAKEHQGHHRGEFLYAEKNRDFKTGEILDLQLMGEVSEDRNVALIIDDLSSYGGTFYHSAIALREAGFEHVFLLIAHAENVILDGKLLEEGSPIDHVFTTDSIFNGEHRNMTVERIYNPLV